MGEESQRSRLSFLLITEIRLNEKPIWFNKEKHAMLLKQSIRRKQTGLQVTSLERKCFEFQTVIFQLNYFSHGKLQLIALKWVEYKCILHTYVCFLDHLSIKGYDSPNRQKIGQNFYLFNAYHDVSSIVCRSCTYIVTISCSYSYRPVH